MKILIYIFSILFFQSIANANLLSDCQNITSKSLSELADLCPIGNEKKECNCEVQFSDDSDSLEAKILKDPEKHPEIEGHIECDGENKFCEFTDEEGNEICDGKLVETPGGIYVGEYDNKGRANGRGMFLNENVVYIGEFSKNRMHKEGALINKNQIIIAKGKHKYGRMHNYNINYDILDLEDINKNIKHKDYNNKIRTTNIIKINTGHNFIMEIIGNSPRRWWPFDIDYKPTGRYICKFAEDVREQIEGGGGGDNSGASGEGGGDGNC